MGLEVAVGTTQFQRGVQLEAVRLVRERGVSVAQAARDLDLHRTCCAIGFGSLRPIRRKPFRVRVR